MQKQVKLIKSQNSSQVYAILVNQQIGRGGFGVVKLGFNVQNKSQKLAIKIIEFNQNQQKQKSQYQLKMMYELPPNPNLVQVKPIKCYSSKNYYLLMEYCEGGTLYQQMKNNSFNQNKIISLFFQIMNGYKALYDKKMLHQDLKPQNILIKNGVYKLADFGISIFYQGYKYGNLRPGTLPYIAPQKLTKKQYYGNHKSDIYAIGVILYEVIVKDHPYLSPPKGQKRRIPKQVVAQLKQAKLRLPYKFQNRFSIQFNKVFEYILKMIQRNDGIRISFEQIWQFMMTDNVFKEYRNKKIQNKVKGKSQVFSQQYNMIIGQISKVITIPLDKSYEQQQIIKNKIKQELQLKQKQQNDRINQKIKNYIIGKRLIVYYLDRFARRIIVQHLKNYQKTLLANKAVFIIMLANRTIINIIHKQIRLNKKFSKYNWCVFLSQQQNKNLLELLKRDDSYIEQSTCDLLSQYSIITKSQIQKYLDVYRQNEIQKMIQQLRITLKDLELQRLNQFIQINNRTTLITHYYLGKLIQLLGDFDSAINQPDKLQSIFTEIQLCTLEYIQKQIIKKCQQFNISFKLDMQQFQMKDQFNKNSNN